jgi:hypothetical protein
MHRKSLAITALAYLAVLIGVAAPASAERVFIYHDGPAPAVIYEPAPVYAPAPAVVSYDPDDRYAATYNLQGVVASFVPYHLTIRIHDQYYPVSLHDGTIIRPTGITLAQAMVVHVDGYWSGPTFIANRIVVLR